MRKVAVYCRVSTLSEDQQTSYIGQQEYFKLYCKDRYDLVEIFADEGLSGTNIKRPQLLKMLESVGVVLEHNHFVAKRIDNKPFDKILVKNTSRLGRNLLQTIEIVNALKENNVYIEFIDNNIDTQDPSSTMMLHLLSIFDQEFSQSISEKVRAGFKVQANTTDKIHCSNKIYGYSYNSATNSLTIIPEEAEVIKLIYQLYLEGKGFRIIGNTLYEKGIRTRQGKRFTKSSIQRILTNEKYASINNRLKYITKGVFTKNGRTAHIRDNANENFKQSDRIEQIISIEDFNKVQEILASKQGDNKGVYRGNTKYSSKIKCSCGASYTSNVDRNDRRYYNCSNKKRYGTKVCSARNITLKFLDDTFTSEWLKNELSSIKLLQKTVIYRQIKELERSKNKDNVEQVNNLNTEVTCLEEQLEKLLDLYLDGAITKDIYNGRQNTINDKINTLKASIQALSKGNNEIDELIDSKRKQMNAVDNLVIKNKYAEQEVLDMISKIEVKGDYLYVTLKVESQLLEILEPIQF